MMIISIPKSASTSLMQTIAKILDIKYQNGISRKKYFIDVPEYSEMQSYHGTTVRRSKEFLTKWISRKDIIYKEHLLPTKEHIDYIRKINKPVVILLRKVDHVIDNYLQSIEKFKSGKMDLREQKGLIIKKLIKIDYEKLKKEYFEFNKLWIESRLKNVLYVNFDDLILKYNRVMRMILDHYGYPEAKIIPLMKAKGNRGDYNTYTGIGEKRLKRQIC